MMLSKSVLRGLLLGFVLSLCATAALAFQISLDEPFTYKGKIYQTFETKDLTLSALLKMKNDLAFVDNHGFGLVCIAISKGEFKRFQNEIYFFPSITVADKTLHQIYPYQFDVERLNAVLAALRTQTPENADAIRKLERIIRFKESQRESTEANANNKREREDEEEVDFEIEVELKKREQPSEEFPEFDEESLRTYTPPWGNFWETLDLSLPPGF